MTTQNLLHALRVSLAEPPSSSRRSSSKLRRSPDVLSFIARAPANREVAQVGTEADDNAAESVTVPGFEPRDLPQVRNEPRSVEPLLEAFTSGDKRVLHSCSLGNA